MAYDPLHLGLCDRCWSSSLCVLQVQTPGMPVLENLAVYSHHCYVTANAAFSQSYMDSEIMAIMSQYMPLDNHNNETRPLREDTAA